MSKKEIYPYKDYVLQEFGTYNSENLLTDTTWCEYNNDWVFVTFKSQNTVKQGKIIPKYSFEYFYKESTASVSGSDSKMYQIGDVSYYQ